MSILAERPMSGLNEAPINATTQQALVVVPGRPPAGEPTMLLPVVHREQQVAAGDQQTTPTEKPAERDRIFTGLLRLSGLRYGAAPETSNDEHSVEPTSTPEAGPQPEGRDRLAHAIALGSLLTAGRDYERTFGGDDDLPLFRSTLAHNAPFSTTLTTRIPGATLQTLEAEQKHAPDAGRQALIADLQMRVAQFEAQLAILQGNDLQTRADRAYLLNGLAATKKWIKIYSDPKNAVPSQEPDPYDDQIALLERIRAGLKRL